MARKPLYNEPTILRTFRVPESKADELSHIVCAFLDRCKLNTEVQNLSAEPTCDCYLEGSIMKRGKLGCKKTKKEHNFK